MLSIEVSGEYKFYEYWWSRWGAMNNIVKRKLFVQFREIEYFIEQLHYKEYFKKLLLLLCEKNYQEIIDAVEKNNNMPNWQYRLIKEDVLLNERCKSKFIAIADDQSYCFLLKSKRTKDVEASPRIN